MQYTQLKLGRQGRVGIITLDHPPLNAFSKRLIWEVLSALDEYEQDEGIRVVLVNSTGKDFSVGADGGDSPNF